MARLICASCGGEVGPDDVLCPWCGVLLSRPGQVLRDPPEMTPGEAPPAATATGGGARPAPVPGGVGPAATAPAGPSTVAGEAPPAAPVAPPAPAPRPTCAAPGCDRPAMTGAAHCRTHYLEHRPARTFRLLTPWSEALEIRDGESVGVGREADFCSFAAELADYPFVSRRHLFLSASKGRLTARDLGSHNGTIRNVGDQLKPDEEVELVAGDSLTLGGQVTFFVQ